MKIYRRVAFSFYQYRKDEIKGKTISACRRHTDKRANNPVFQYPIRAPEFVVQKGFYSYMKAFIQKRATYES